MTIEPMSAENVILSVLYHEGAISTEDLIQRVRDRFANLTTAVIVRDVSRLFKLGRVRWRGELVVLTPVLDHASIEGRIDEEAVSLIREHFIDSSRAKYDYEIVSALAPSSRQLREALWRQIFEMKKAGVLHFGDTDMRLRPATDW